jgi:hypothetical protein
MNEVAGLSAQVICPTGSEASTAQNVELSLVESSDVSGTTADDYYKLLWSKSGEINSKKYEGISRTIYRIVC